MNELQRLIKEMCPDGVRFEKIGTLVGVNRGRRLTKKQLDDSFEYEVYHGSKDTILGKYNHYNAPANTTLVVNTGGIGGIKFLDKPFWCSDGSFWLGHSNQINDKYLYYALSGYESYFASKKRSGGVPTIDREVVETFRIPVPPLAIQNEIVRILDSFTNLIANLSIELVNRKIQYQYYLDNMFENCSGVQKSISDIGSLTRGKRFVHADAVEENGVPCIHYGELYTHYGVFATDARSQIRKSILEEKKLRYAQKGDVIIVGAGENNEDIGVGVSWEGDYPVAVHDACYIFVTDQNPRFVSFYLRSNYYHKQIKSYVAEGKICAISSDGIGKAKIKVPSLEEQLAIVAKLENFYLLISDRTHGIPAEIEARQKQYEYYRDKLLTFKELEA